MADIQNEVPCVNPAADGACAHPASLHADVEEGTNAGECMAEGCNCPEMVPDAEHPQAPPEADGKTPAKVMPKAAAPAAPAPAKPAAPPVAPPAKKAAASVHIATDADGHVKVYNAAGALLFDQGETIPDDADPGEAGTVGGTSFELPVMVLEGVETGDRRRIEPEALTYRELPLPLMAVTSTTMGHDGAELVGRIETMERYDASTLTNPKTGEPYGPGVWAWKGSGSFTSAENAQTVADLIRDGFLRGVSVDMGDVTGSIEFLDPNTGEPVDPDSLSDEDFWDAPIQEVITAGRLMGATVCPFPAFEGAYITLDGPEGTDPADITQPPKAAIVASGRPRFPSIRVVDEPMGNRDCETCTEGRPLVASGGGPMKPPAEWYDNPGFDRLTPLTVTDDGRIFGHLAGWSTCHTGVTNVCTMAPKSRTNYGYFQTGYVVTAEGEQRSTGAITLNTGHASETLGFGPAKEHYDHTGSAVADVAAGEDAFGIWISGATRPDITELEVRTLRASALSGDWRNVGGNLELVAALAVNVPGFPAVRARVASGMPETLVAAGARQVIRQRSETQQADAESRLTATLNRLDQFLLAEAANKLRMQVHAAKLITASG